MKFSTVLLLPLAVSAAVVRPRHEHTAHTLSNRQTVAPAGPKESTDPATWSDTFSYVGGLVNSAYQLWGKASTAYDSITTKVPEVLPEYLHAAVTSIAWYMQWTAKPVKKEYMKPELDQTAKKTVMRYGPFTLMGQKYNRTKIPIIMDPKSDIIIRTLKGMPDNSAILSGRLDAIMEDGSKADVSKGIYIHHLLVADVGKKTAPFAFCPNGHNQKAIDSWLASHVVESVGAGLIQSGNDQVGAPNIYAALKGDKKAAFLTGWDDTFLMEAEIVNYNQENTTIYMIMETEYLPDKPAGYLDSSTVIFSATGCEAPAYHPPKNSNKYNFTSDGFTMTYDGWVINSRGHLHDGGTAMQMTLNDQVVCESTPTYGGKSGLIAPNGKEWQTITSMSRCEDPWQFKKNDVIKLISIYDTDLHPLRPAGTAKEGEGHGHGHGGAKAGEGMGMEGMDEMGIFTTNIAINNPAANAVEKPSSKPAGAARPAGGMAGMSGMDNKKVHSKRYGMIDLPEAIYPI